MQSINENKDRMVTAGIIVISLLGLGYFGYQAFYKTASVEPENPFDYNIEHFKQNDPSLNLYREITAVKTDFQTLNAIAIGPDNRLYLAGDQSFAVFDRHLQPERTIPCGTPVRAMAVDQNQDIYLAMENYLQIFDKDGVQKHRWTDFPAKTLLTSVAVTAGNVYTADAGNFVVYKFDKNGNRLLRIGEKDARRQIPGFIIPSPFFDLAIDPDGFIWVVNPGRQSLENYTAEGDLRTAWGEAGMDVERFCGCCNPSHLAIFNDGSFVTAEKGIARVKVYNRLGRLIAVVAGPDQFSEGTVGLDLAVDSENRVFVLDPKRKLVRIFERKNSQMEVPVNETS